MASGREDYYTQISSDIPKAGADQVPWFQSENAVVAATDSEDLINYVVPDLYELHVCSGVVSTNFPRIQRYDLRQTPAATWVSPTSYSEPDGWWYEPAKAFDGSLSTWSVCNAAPNAWSTYLYLLINEVYIDKIKYYVKQYSEGITKIDIDVWYDGDWHDVYEGAFTELVWEEKDIGDERQLVSKARVRFYNSKPVVWLYLRLYEFMFNTKETTPQQGVWFDTQAMFPVHPLAPYIITPQSTFSVRLYNDDAAEHQMSTFLTGFLQKVT